MPRLAVGRQRKQAAQGGGFEREVGGRHCPGDAPGPIPEKVEQGEHAGEIRQHAGGHAEHLQDRTAISERLLLEALPGDRIAILGARDDTLTEFAVELVRRLGT